MPDLVSTVLSVLRLSARYQPRGTQGYQAAGSGGGASAQTDATIEPKLRSGDRVLLRNVPTRGFDNQLELIRPKQRIVAQFDAKPDRLFELLHEILLVLEHVHGHVGMNADHHRILLPFQSHPPHRPLHAPRDRLRGEHSPGAV